MLSAILTIHCSAVHWRYSCLPWAALGLSPAVPLCIVQEQLYWRIRLKIRNRNISETDQCRITLEHKHFSEVGEIKTHFELQVIFLATSGSLSILLVGVMTSVSWPLEYFEEATAARLISSLTYYNNIHKFKNLWDLLKNQKYTYKSNYSWSSFIFFSCWCGYYISE